MHERGKGIGLTALPTTADNVVLEGLPVRRVVLGVFTCETAGSLRRAYVEADGRPQ